MFNFQIEHSSDSGDARSGVFATPHGTIKTPVFMPCGTKGTVKTLSQKELVALDAQIILGNTYHLYLRPGTELIKELGGLHQWIKWPRPILTDSGGFQVFSLAQDKQYGAKNEIKTKVKITEEGVQFKSHIDGSKHFFTPEKVMEFQHNIGADIIMAFDECAPADSTKNYFNEAMDRTHRWVKKCKKRHMELNEQQSTKQALFPICQGGVFTDLRKESAKFINDLDLPGNAIGGLSVGESKEEMYQMIEAVIPHLSKEKPRYLMGVGKPEDILEAVDRGVDMMDCVHPTRIARHGAFWTSEGRMNITNAHFQKDQTPLDPNLPTPDDEQYSRSYVHHLFKEKEILGQKILSAHNLRFLFQLMSNIRKSIAEGNFKTFKKNFLNNFLHFS